MAEMSRAARRYGGKEPEGKPTAEKPSEAKVEAKPPVEERREPKDGKGPRAMMARHADERDEMHKTHEKERRDLHGQHRDAMRDMHGRHEQAFKAMHGRQMQEADGGMDQAGGSAMPAAPAAGGDGAE